MKLKKSLVLLLIIILITIGITSVVYSRLRIIKSQDFQLVGYVSDQPGIGFNGTQILLGAVSPGGKGTRFLNALNSFPFEVKVYFQVFGNISSYLEITPKITLAPNSTKEISVVFMPAKDAEYGKYTGTLRAIYKRK